MEKNKHNWTERRSEISGFSTAHYRSGNKGDYVRIDVNIQERKVRLLVEDRSESRYVAVIHNRVVVEESNTTTDSFQTAKILRKNAPFFSRIADPKIFSLINGFYGISVRYRKKQGSIPGRKTRNHLILIVFIAIVCFFVLFLVFYFK
jgi:hypothetical protein